VTDPPRGIIRPAIQAALTALLLTLAGIGWLERQARQPPSHGHRCPACPHKPKNRWDEMYSAMSAMPCRDPQTGDIYADDGGILHPDGSFSFPPRSVP
jgi:hypothetical protein